ncbi:NADPH:quinone oxidoreductase [Mycolicibacterium moriokaense]|uniref:Alcohol dehydrogenase n=1 Tax=Mycolicibacterium moriokaense TaxID=39691 RepID=A0AAD1H9J5_9MYCO|nr:NADPH:quinone oxidoreductase family protein [Mycolicibacterium moriokaense]MCV7041797.1 NADPH:quinone oxidoreductase family protein [Mycolicibacterium moriokaense]ORB20711.1 NADPH:quinone oxidoreductase [Mycolicibacterium moriokaense]BBX01417.1 alcohol dehydrogenase [Mycolicibacterium moriokaense]
MRAAVCPAYGRPDVVRIEELPSPTVGPGQVRVRVAAAAVNFPDVLLIADKYQVSVPAPFVPGSEFSGVIVETGSDAEGFAVGDRVTGAGMYGAFAEEVAVAAAGLAPIPDSVDDRTAAAFGVAYRTAYHTLRSVARVKAGDEVVVLGAGGGVGLAAVALAVQLGASVTAVASSDEKLDVASSYGARHVVNHKRDDLRGALKAVLPGGADAVVDPVGGELSEPALRSLGRGGRFVTVGFASGDIPRIPLNLVLMKGIAVLGFQFQDVPPDEFTRNEDELREHLVSGRVRPHVGAVYPLTETVRALEHVADGRAIGKILIDLT